MRRAGARLICRSGCGLRRFWIVVPVRLHRMANHSGAAIALATGNGIHARGTSRHRQPHKQAVGRGWNDQVFEVVSPRSEPLVNSCSCSCIGAFRWSEHIEITVIIRTASMFRGALVHGRRRDGRCSDSASRKCDHRSHGETPSGCSRSWLQRFEHVSSNVVKRVRISCSWMAQRENSGSIRCSGLFRSLSTMRDHGRILESTRCSGRFRHTSGARVRSESSSQRRCSGPGLRELALHPATIASNMIDLRA